MVAEVQQAPLQLAFVRERDARSGARGDCDRGGDDWREGRDRDGGPAGEGQVCPPPVAPGTPWPPSLPPLEGPTRVWVTLGSPLVCARPQLVESVQRRSCTLSCFLTSRICSCCAMQRIVLPGARVHQHHAAPYGQTTINNKQ